MNGKTSFPFSLATVLELAGAALIFVGVRDMFAPLGWLWLGLVAFAGSYLLELQRHAERQAPRTHRTEAATSAADDVDQVELEPAWTSDEAEVIPSSVKLTRDGLVRT
jgi:hypothetical protein